MDYHELGRPTVLSSAAPIAGSGSLPTGSYAPPALNGHANGHVAKNGHATVNGNGHVAPKVSVVIPALNEEKNIPLVFANLPEDVYEVILVDGRSTDDTVAVARSIRPDVRVVGQARPGKGNALICGFEASRGDIIVALDADGSTDAAEIARFVAALEDGADFVKGSRFLDGGGSADLTLLRKAGNWVLRTSVNILHGTRYTDLCYGYNAFWRRCLPQLALDCDGFEIETVMNIRAARANLQVAEVPSYEGSRVYGQSNLSVVRDGWRILKAIVAEQRRARALKLGRRAPELEVLRR